MAVEYGLGRCPMQGLLFCEGGGVHEKIKFLFSLQQKSWFCEI